MIKVIITDGKRTYSEDVTEEQRESFEECSTNGANPWLTDFDRYTRSLPEFELKTKLIERYNTRDEDAHFIFGWCECFFQSDDVPGWMYDPDVRLKIEVKNTEEER
jgi:hypothetical protein